MRSPLKIPGNRLADRLAYAYHYTACCLPNRHKDPHYLLLQVYLVLTGLAAVLGVVLIAGGPPRFGSPSFAGPRTAATFVMPLVRPEVTWGVIFVLGGLVMLSAVGHRLAWIALAVGMFVHLFLAWCFLLSVFAQPMASLTGVVAYGTFAVLHAILAAHVRVHGWR